MRSIVWLVLLVLLGSGALWWFAQQSGLPPIPGTPATQATSAAGIARGEHEGGAPGSADEDSTRQRVAAVPDTPQQDLLTGRLLQGGAPLVGVDVLVCKGASANAEILQRTTTDRGGRFQLKRDTSYSWLTATGEAVPRHWKVGWRVEGDTILDLEVPLPGVLEGVVRSPEGAAIADAEVALKVTSGLYSRVHVAGWPEVSMRTDAQGRFRFERVAVGEERLSCRAEGYAYKSSHRVEVVPGALVSTEIVMQAGATLRGLVLDHRGQPLSDAEVDRSFGSSIKTDALGQFELPHFLRKEVLQFRAAGHLERDVKKVDVDKLLRVKLERSVTMRGIVNGANGRPGTVYIAPASRLPDASRTPCYDLTYDWHDVVRDGRFELSGFSMSDFEVTVRIPGVGRAGPKRVEMRGDVDVVFEVVPFREVVVVVRDDLGQVVPGATLVRDRGMTGYPSLYRDDDPKLLKRVSGSHKRDEPQSVVDGEVLVGLSPDEPLAFLVDADGHIPVARAIIRDALPERLEVTLLRAGSLRGVVVGDEEELRACQTYVQVLPADNEEPVASRMVDDDGQFAIPKLAPGSYHAILSRSNTASIGDRSFGLPLIDQDRDPRAVVPFEVAAGAAVTIELHAPKLGRLVGRLTVHGEPVAGAAIFANRPMSKAERKRKRRWDFGEYGDWDNELLLEFACGQRTRKDGSFTILYRDAGPVEVRVRHADGHTTALPIVVELPPPGDDVVRNFEIPAGEIRGRYPIEQLTARERRFFEITLFPLTKSVGDPFYAPHHGTSIDMSCAKVEKSKDGRFAFSYLRPGQWLVRAHSYRSQANVVLWQRVLSVHNDVVDLGELPVVASAEAKVAWRWQGKPSGAVVGVWLRQVQAGDVPSVWAGTYRAQGASAKCEILPGHYEVVPFGWPGFDHGRSDSWSLGISGEALAKPQRVRVRAGGLVEPAEVVFVALPVKEGK